jgi:hypothetical protein
MIFFISLKIPNYIDDLQGSSRQGLRVSVALAMRNNGKVQISFDV